MTGCDYCELSIDTESDGTNGSAYICSHCRTLQKRDHSIRVRPVNQGDLELLLAWRSNPKIYRHFRLQTSPLEWEEHVSWFESRPPDRFDFIIEYGGRRVGVVSLDPDDEIGIYLGDFSAHDQGVATAVLNWALDRFEERIPLYAEIHEKNSDSKRLFKRCGFDKNDRQGEWLQYIYDS